MLITPSSKHDLLRRASFSWSASTQSTGDSSSYSFNNTNIGDITGHSTRTIFVITAGDGGNTGGASVTVGGNSATRLIGTGGSFVDTISIHRIRLDTSATQATIGVVRSMYSWPMISSSPRFFLELSHSMRLHLRRQSLLIFPSLKMAALSQDV
jgi:hypothetical protein